MWLIINKRPWLDTNPIVNVSLQAAYGLAEAGERVEFVAAGRTTDWQADLTRYYGLVPHPNLAVRVIPRFRVGRASGSFPLYLYPLWKLRPWRQGGAVQVFSRDSAMLPFMVLLKKLYGARIVLEVHHAYANVARLAAAGHRLSQEERKSSFLERNFLKYVDLLVCITAPQAELYREIFPDLPVAVLPLAARLRPSLPPTEKFARRTLVYIGRLAETKGLQTMLRAMALVQDTITLLIIGGYQRSQAEVQKEIDHLGLKVRVRQLGALPPAELYRVCAREASAGLLPLEDFFYNRNLTSPAKLGDYLSHGLPVIASRLPTTEALLSEREAIFFSPGDAVGLATAIRELFANRERYLAMVAAAAERAREWNWQRRATQLVNWAEGGLDSPAPMAARSKAPIKRV